MILPTHITATLFIVPFILIFPGFDLGSSYVAKATGFYWVMSFPVGTAVATSLPVWTLHHESILTLCLAVEQKLAQRTHRRAHTHTPCGALGAQAFYRYGLWALVYFLVALQLWNLMFGN